MAISSADRRVKNVQVFVEKDAVETSFAKWALFTTRKEILGWCLDTCRGTIELTEKKERQLIDFQESDHAGSSSV